MNLMPIGVGPADAGQPGPVLGEANDKMGGDVFGSLLRQALSMTGTAENTGNGTIVAQGSPNGINLVQTGESSNPLVGKAAKEDVKEGDETTGELLALNLMASVVGLTQPVAKPVTATPGSGEDQTAVTAVGASDQPSHPLAIDVLTALPPNTPVAGNRPATPDELPAVSPTSQQPVETVAAAPQSQMPAVDLVQPLATAAPGETNKELLKVLTSPEGETAFQDDVYAAVAAGVLGTGDQVDLSLEEEGAGPKAKSTVEPFAQILAGSPQPPGMAKASLKADEKENPANENNGRAVGPVDLRAQFETPSGNYVSRSVNAQGQGPQASEADVVDQVVRHARLMSVPGRTSMQLRLEPESLGKLDLKLVLEGSALTLNVSAGSQEVKRIIESNLPQLRNSFAEQGINVDRLIIEVSQQAQASFDTMTRRENPGQGLPFQRRGNQAKEADSSLEQIEAVTVGYAVRPGGIDLRG